MVKQVPIIQINKKKQKMENISSTFMTPKTTVLNKLSPLEQLIKHHQLVVVVDIIKMVNQLS